MPKLQGALSERPVAKILRQPFINSPFPTTDGRELVFCGYTQPEKDQKMLLTQLKWELSPQSPPRISQKGEVLKD